MAPAVQYVGCVTSELHSQPPVTEGQCPEAFSVCLQRIRYVNLSATPPVLANVSVSSVTLNQPVGVTVLPNSPTTLLVADSLNDIVRRYVKSGATWTHSRAVGIGTTVTDGLLNATTLVDPRGIAVASDGSIWIAGRG